MFRNYFYLLILSGCIYYSKGFGNSTPPRPAAFKSEQFGNHWYFFTRANTGTRNMSNILCSRLRMRLISIETKEENEFVASKIPEYFLYSSSVFMWSSGESFGNGFIWASTGKSIDYTNWKYGQPDTEYGQKPYVRLVYDNYTKTLEWEMESNSARGFTICETRM